MLSPLDLLPMGLALRVLVVLHLQALGLCVVACRLHQRRTTLLQAHIIPRHPSLLPRLLNRSRRHHHRRTSNSRRSQLASRIQTMVLTLTAFHHHLLPRLLI